MVWIIFKGNVEPCSSVHDQLPWDIHYCENQKEVSNQVQSTVQEDKLLQKKLMLRGAEL